MVLVAAGAPSAGDIPGLLRRRLRFFSLLVVTINVLNTVYAGRLVDASLALVVNAGLAALLWSRAPLSWRGLRLAELAALGSVAVDFGMDLWDQLRSGLTPQPPGGRYVRLLAQAAAIEWFCLIMVYGLFIPNTWRRCAVVVGSLALAPVLLTLAASRAPAEPTRDFLFELILWVGGGAAIAVYGSSRIEVLRREVDEARRLGQYRLGRRLGGGGMGEVYLAEHVLLRRPCAVKLIRPEKAGDPAALARFEREVRATATLTHPNTVQVFDYGHAEDGTFYYVMEYLPGMSLEEMVARHGPLPAGRAVHFLRQVCGSLAEAHAIGLVHRDLKPANVIVGERGGVRDVAKLLDFGLVRTIDPPAADDRLTRDGAVAGTPAFMSPEQADGEAELDGRSDLYSLGAVAYFLLTGRPPFVKSTVLQVLFAHAREPVKPPSEVRPGVPADLEAVVLTCLEKDPARRFAGPTELADALGRCRAAGEWTEAEAAGWWRDAAARGGPGAPEGET
jgi:serine/threonine-protein kinase